MVVELAPGNDLLKNEDNETEHMRKIVMNRWNIPNAMDYAARKEEKLKEK